MEGYIKKINDRVLKKHDVPEAKKIKNRFRIIGGVILGAGLAGLIACVIAFAVHFVEGNTETAFTCWMIAIPFIVLFVAGSVVTRVGDQLLHGLVEEKKEKKKQHLEKKK